MKFNIFGYELKLEFKEKTKRKGYSRRSWTTSETNTLLKFRNEGKSWKEIGELMNRTAQACQNRWYVIHKGKKK